MVGEKWRDCRKRSHWQFCIFVVMVYSGHATSYAQGYRCEVDGKPVFQQMPCEGGKRLDVPPALAPDSYEARASAAIGRQRVFIGMLEKDVVRSWGKPSKVNRSVGSYGIHEQWIYERGEIGRTQYLYVENGVLKGIQGPTD